MTQDSRIEFEARFYSAKHREKYTRDSSLYLAAWEIWQDAKASEAERRQAEPGDYIWLRSILAMNDDCENSGQQRFNREVRAVLAERDALIGSVTQPAPVVPEGFRITRNENGFGIEVPSGGYIGVQRSKAGNTVAHEVLYDLCMALSAAQEGE